MEFPKMIYLGGEHGAAHRIVADEAAQDAAKADGFLPFGAAVELDEKAELIAALEAAGIEHKKSWGVAKLREALDAKPE